MAELTPQPMAESSTTAMMGQIQSCFFKNKRVRDIDRPTEVWPNVMCACPARATWVEGRNQRVSEEYMASHQQLGEYGNISMVVATPARR